MILVWETCIAIQLSQDTEAGHHRLRPLSPPQTPPAPPASRPRRFFLKGDNAIKRQSYKLLLHDLVGHFGGLWLEAGALGLASKTLYPFAVDFIFDSFTVFY